MPMLGVGGMQLYRAETPGPMKDTKVDPQNQGNGQGAVVYLSGINCRLCAGLLAGWDVFFRCTRP